MEAVPRIHSLQEQHFDQGTRPLATSLVSQGSITLLAQDLTYLGRPLERTIILDTNASHFQLQPDNGIALQPWTGTRGDATSRELVSLIPFLEALAIKGVKDVRPVIKHYEGKHIPTAYAEAEAKTKKALLDKWEEDRKNQGAVGGWFSAALGSLVKVRCFLCDRLIVAGGD